MEPGGTFDAAPREVAPDVWRISTPMPYRPRHVHAYLCRLDGGAWMLVDGGLGTEEAWTALDAGVRAVAGGWRALARIVLTHMHLDHVGLAARAAEASGAPVATGRLDAERMARAAAHPEAEAAYRAALLRGCGAHDAWIREAEALRAQPGGVAAPVAVADALDGEGGPVPDAPGWRFAWTPGHTAGHVSLHRPADGVVLAGDAVMERITPTLGVNPQRADPVGDYLAALDRLAALGPRALHAGHHAPPADPAARIAALRREADGETDAVAAALADGAARTAWEAAAARYAGRDLPPAQRMQALRETRAHLDRLVLAGRARAEEVDGAVRFRRA